MKNLLLSEIYFMHTSNGLYLTPFDAFGAVSMIKHVKLSGKTGCDGISHALIRAADFYLSLLLLNLSSLFMTQANFPPFLFEIIENVVNEDLVNFLAPRFLSVRTNTAS